MQSNGSPEAYLKKRRGLLRAWRYAGPLLLLMVGVLAVYVFIRTPMMINPFAVIAALEAGTLAPDMLRLMAVFVPMLFVTVCFLLVVLVLLMYVAFANERKYLEILDSRETPSRPAGQD